MNNGLLLYIKLAITRNNGLYWTELKAIVRCLKVNYFVWHLYCFIFCPTQILLDTSSGKEAENYFSWIKNHFDIAEISW